MADEKKREQHEGTDEDMRTQDGEAVEHVWDAEAKAFKPVGKAKAASPARQRAGKLGKLAGKK